MAFALRTDVDIGCSLVEFFKHVALGMFEAFVAAFPACSVIGERLRLNAAAGEQGHCDAS